MIFIVYTFYVQMNRKSSGNIKIAVDTPVKRKKKDKTIGRRERDSSYPRKASLGSYFCVIALWCLRLNIRVFVRD